jgi:hypothetical protein
LELLLSLFALLAGFSGVISGGRVPELRQVQAGSAIVAIAYEASAATQAEVRAEVSAPTATTRIVRVLALRAVRPLIAFVAKDERRLE